MKVYKVEIFVMDFDEIGPDRIKEAIEYTEYPNRCISPTVKNIESKDIGKWYDSHPLNNRNTCDAEYESLFGLLK